MWETEIPFAISINIIFKLDRLNCAEDIVLPRCIKYVGGKRRYIIFPIKSVRAAQKGYVV